MNPTSKKFISLFLVFSLMMLYANLYAKERRGAKLIVTKLDGQRIKGELITVKPNSLLLLDTEGKDVSVGIADIKVIRIVYKKLGAVGGALVGALGGAVAGVTLYGSGGIVLALAGVPVAVFARIGALVGLIAGAILGEVVERGKTIRIEGKSASEIQKTLDKLRKEARIRDYK